MSFAILGAIANGDADADLGAIIEAATARKKALSATTFAALAVGDRVRVTGGQKKYEGREGTVVEKRLTKVVVNLDGVGRLACPTSLIEKVAS